MLKFDHLKEKIELLGVWQTPRYFVFFYGLKWEKCNIARLHALLIIQMADIQMITHYAQQQKLFKIKQILFWQNT